MTAANVSNKRMCLTKSFDKVPYQRLLQKLAFCGIRGQLNEWIYRFLSDCTQAVVLNGSRSDEINVTSGVPQGSVLGPILFTIFINDLPKEVKSHARLFANDCIIYRSIKNQEKGKYSPRRHQKFAKMGR